MPKTSGTKKHRRFVAKFTFPNLLNSEDLNVDEDPPPAPVAEVDAGLVKELERLEEKSGDSEEIQETPEDGIIDDDAVENDGDGEAGSVKAEEDLKSGGTSEDVLASG